METNIFLNRAFIVVNRFGVDTTEQFLFALGILVFILLIVSLTFKAITTYTLLRFTLMREFSIGKRLVEGYLHQPYSWFLSHNSADMGKTILSEVSQVIGGGITPIMNLITQGVVAIALLTLLILIDPKLALIVGLTVTAFYSLIYKATRVFLARMGTERVKANQKRFTAVSEAFGASKEIKVGGLEQAYIQRFSEPAQTFARLQTLAQIISQLPRFALEAIAFGGILLLMLYLMKKSGSFASAIPVISLYASAGYRLMPSLQQIYSAITQLRFAGPAIDALHADLMSLKPTLPYSCKGSIPLNQAITLKHIQYGYPNTTKPVLKNLIFTILSNSMVGLVGAVAAAKLPLQI